jgi:hypothetical protein
MSKTQARGATRILANLLLLLLIVVKLVLLAVRHVVQRLLNVVHTCSRPLQET